MRHAGNIGIGSSFPPVGKYQCMVIALNKGTTQQKKTPYIEVVFSTGEDEFPDQLFVTAKTLGRLCFFAKRVCGMPDEYELSDDDKEASVQIAKYIMQNALNKICYVTIEETDEEFIPTSGPDMGRKIKKTRRRVAFRGYDRYPDASGTSETNASTANVKDLKEPPLPWEEEKGEGAKPSTSFPWEES